MPSPPRNLPFFYVSVNVVLCHCSVPIGGINAKKGPFRCVALGGASGSCSTQKVPRKKVHTVTAVSNCFYSISSFWSKYILAIFPAYKVGTRSTSKDIPVDIVGIELYLFVYL